MLRSLDCAQTKVGQVLAMKLSCLGTESDRQAETPSKTALTCSTLKNLLVVVQDVDGWKSTTYYEDAGKTETGFKMTGMNTSSSVGDMQAIGEEA